MQPVPVGVRVRFQHGGSRKRSALPSWLSMRQRDDALRRLSASSTVPHGLLLRWRCGFVLCVPGGALGRRARPHVGCVLWAVRRRARGRVSVAELVGLLIHVPCGFLLSRGDVERDAERLPGRDVLSRRVSRANSVRVQ